MPPAFTRLFRAVVKVERIERDAGQTGQRLGFRVKDMFQKLQRRRASLKQIIGPTTHFGAQFGRYDNRVDQPPVIHCRGVVQLAAIPHFFCALLADDAYQ